MILDASAIVALLFQEPGWEALLETMEAATRLACGGPTLAEAAIVTGARRGFEVPLVPRFVQTFEVDVLAFGSEHWLEAARAYRRYGKGRHQAALNFGDCLAYATARLAAEPLLCVGNDFAATDLDLASV